MEDLLSPFPVRREGSVKLDLLEFGGRERALSVSKRQEGRVVEVREEVQKIVP